MRKILSAIAVLLVLLAGLRTAGDAHFWMRYAATVLDAGAQAQARTIRPRLRIAGEPGGLPRATPVAESVLPAALAEAGEQARRRGLRALVVHRHGHRVHQQFADGIDGTRQVVGGELSAVPFALALGVLADHGRVSFDAALQALRDASATQPGWRNPWSRTARQRFTLRAAPPLLPQDADGDVATTLAQRVWQPLGAADAWLWGRDDAALRVDCCMVARLDDWMRLADLLLAQGTWAGTRLASPDWIRHLLARDASGHAHPVWLAMQAPWQGDEPPVERDAYWFDLASDLRIWIAPRRGVQVLVWGGGARDTLIPNIILRGLADQAPAIGGSTLDELVPGH